MLGMRGFYITKAEYDSIRKNLVSNNNQLIKIALQNLITKLEYGQRMNNVCSKDLCAVLYDVVQNDDYKIRKWAYHLIVYKQNRALVNRCIHNLKSGFEKDAENISWILAIVSRSYNSDMLHELYKKCPDTKISQQTYTLCSTLFSSNSNMLNAQEINHIVDGEDFLSKMWLTKVFGCNYNRQKKRDYSNLINANVMNSLLQDTSIQRYALWAFSTLEKVNVKVIEINPYDAKKLPSKSLAWYYTGLFKDENYIQKNVDHIINILEDFLIYPQVVQMGILRGICSAHYPLGEMLYPIASAFLELDENDDKQLPLVILFIQILIDHEKESGEITKILKDYSDSTTCDELRRLLWYREGIITEESNMGIVINGNVGNIQNNEGISMANQNNILFYTESDSTLNPQSIQQDVNQIKEKVVAGEFDGYFEGENDELEALFEKVQYGFNSAKRSNVVKEKEVLELLSKVEVDLRELAHESKTDKKKSRFSDMLSKVSQICSISVNAPKLWPLLKDAVDFIKQFLHILEI